MDSEFLIRAVVLAGAASLVACAGVGKNENTDYRAIVASPDRSEADRQTDHGRRPARVDDLPEREFCAARPDVCTEDRPEQSAPLADAALGDIEDVNQLTREELEVLPDIEDARADQAQHHHPRHAISAVADVDVVLARATA